MVCLLTFEEAIALNTVKCGVSALKGIFFPLLLLLMIERYGFRYTVHTVAILFLFFGLGNETVFVLNSDNF